MGSNFPALLGTTEPFETIGRFFQAIFDMPTPFNMVVLIVLICTVAGVITSIATQIRKYACHRHDVAFKRELVERGLAIDEIERLIAAKGSVDTDSSHHPKGGAAA
jgi:hypothetical protein